MDIYTAIWAGASAPFHKSSRQQVEILAANVGRQRIVRGNPKTVDIKFFQHVREYIPTDVFKKELLRQLPTGSLGDSHPDHRNTSMDRQETELYAILPQLTWTFPSRLLHEAGEGCR